MVQVTGVCGDLEPRGGHAHVSVGDLRVDVATGAASSSTGASAAGGKHADAGGWQPVLARLGALGANASTSQPLHRTGSVPPDSKGAAPFARALSAATPLTPQRAASMRSGGAGPMQWPGGQIHGMHTSRSSTLLTSSALGHTSHFQSARPSMDILLSSAQAVAPPLVAATAAMGAQRMRISVQPLQLHVGPALVDTVLLLSASLRAGTAAPVAGYVAPADFKHLPLGSARVLAAADANACLEPTSSASAQLSLDGLSVTLSLEPPTRAAELLQPQLGDSNSQKRPSSAWLKVQSVTLRTGGGSSAGGRSASAAVTGADSLAAAADDARVLQDRCAGGWVRGRGPKAATSSKMVDSSDATSNTAAHASTAWLALTEHGATMPEDQVCELLSSSTACSVAAVSAGFGAAALFDGGDNWHSPPHRPLIEIEQLHGVVHQPAVPIIAPEVTMSLQTLSLDGMHSDLDRVSAAQEWVEALRAAAQPHNESRAAKAPRVATPGAIVQASGHEIRLCVTRDDVPAAPALQLTACVLDLLVRSPALGSNAPTPAAAAPPQLKVKVDTGELALSVHGGRAVDVLPAYFAHVPATTRRVAAGVAVACCACNLRDVLNDLNCGPNDAGRCQILTADEFCPRQDPVAVRPSNSRARARLLTRSIDCRRSGSARSHTCL